MNERFFFACAVALLALQAPAQPLTEGMKLIASDGATGDEFGGAVDIDAGVIVVGARLGDEGGLDSGSAYLFDAQTGAELHKLIPNDSSAGDLFGIAVAIHDGLVAVGAPQDDDNGPASGSVYVFSATSGAQIAKLTPNDASAGGLFGSSVAIHDGIVAAGAIGHSDNGAMSGAAYLFDSTSGNQLDKVLPEVGAPNQAFGISIALDSGMLAVGSRSYFVLGEGFTLASVRVFDTETGDLLRTMTADNGVWTDMFAADIDLDRGQLAVGAWARSVFFDHSGAAYFFDVPTGEQLHYVVPADGHDRDHFGVSVAISDGIVAIGAHQDDDSGFNAGTVYIYDADSGGLLEKLVASDGESFDLFGTSVGIDGGIIVAGATGHGENGTDSGAIYVYGQSTNACAGDCDGSGDVDFNDLVSMLFEFGNETAPVECDADASGVVEFNDLVTALFAFGPCN